jgi:hypothetical protein
VGTTHQNSGRLGAGGQCPPYRSVAGLFLLISFAVFRLPPWLPLFVTESNGVDPSWQMLLNEAVPNGWTFGRDLFFTYGPFGFIHARMYHPETWTVLVTVWVGISIIMADLVWRVAGHGRLTSTWRTLVGVGILELMSRDAMATCFGFHALVFMEALHVPIDVPADEERKATHPYRVTIANAIRMSLPVLLLAALPWAKFSYFVTASFLGCSLVAMAVLQRRFPWRSVLLFTACPLAWLMSGATLAECGEFIATGFQLAGGYSAAMGLGPATTAGMIVVVTSACVVLLLPIWFTSRIHSQDWRLRMLTTLFLHRLLFIVWKSCFVRYHAARIPVFLGTVFPLLAYAGFVLRREERFACTTGSASAARLETSDSYSHWRSQWHTFLSTVRGVEVRCCLPVLLSALVVLFSAGAVERVSPFSFGQLTRSATGPLRDQVLALAESAKVPDWRQQVHVKQLAKIRNANPIPDVDGTADIFPSKLAVAFAHGLKLRPRPLLQGYAAFTPELIERDTQHFSGPNAPDHVLIAMGEIDGRLPTIEDSRVWFELLSSYDLADSSSELLKLSRREQPGLLLNSEPASSTTVKFGEQVKLPAALTGPVWCRIRIEPSLAGRAASILHRLPELRLRLHGNDGNGREFRLLPGATKAGFLVSQVVDTREDLIRLWQWRDDFDSQNASNEDRVVSMACATANEDWGKMLFELDVTVEFFECFKRVEQLPESDRPIDVATRARSAF